MSLKFVGLHAHTVFSVADGLGYPKDHYKYAQENGMDALATTDHGNANAFGYMAEESLKFKKAGNPFKIIYGVEAYFHPSLSDWKKLKEAKDSGDEVVETFIENEKETKGKYYDPIRRRHHLVIVAKNYIGLTNLFRLITESYRQGFYRFPRVDYKMLEKYNDGLIVSTACVHPEAKIITSNGIMKMSEVVTLVKEGEKVQVLGRDLKNNKDVFEEVTWGDLTKFVKKIYKIKLKDGKELKVTGDHKIYTNKGWVQARDLTKNHKILAL